MRAPPRPVRVRRRRRCRWTTTSRRAHDPLAARPPPRRPRRRTARHAVRQPRRPGRVGRGRRAVDLAPAPPALCASASTSSASTRAASRAAPPSRAGRARVRRGVRRHAGRDRRAEPRRVAPHGARPRRGAAGCAAARCSPTSGRSTSPATWTCCAPRVGDERLTYLGLSYGTYLGTVYANLFPDRVRALVLDGAYDPTAYRDRPYDYDRGQYVALERSLSHFLRWCSAIPAAAASGTAARSRPSMRWSPSWTRTRSGWRAAP